MVFFVNRHMVYVLSELVKLRNSTNLSIPHQLPPTYIFLIPHLFPPFSFSCGKGFWLGYLWILREVPPWVIVCIFQAFEQISSSAADMSVSLAIITSPQIIMFLWWLFSTFCVWVNVSWVSWLYNVYLCRLYLWIDSSRVPSSVNKHKQTSGNCFYFALNVQFDIL